MPTFSRAWNRRYFIPIVKSQHGFRQWKILTNQKCPIKIERASKTVTKHNAQNRSYAAFYCNIRLHFNGKLYRHKVFSKGHFIEAILMTPTGSISSAHNHISLTIFLEDVFPFSHDSVKFAWFVTAESEFIASCQCSLRVGPIHSSLSPSP